MSLRTAIIGAGGRIQETVLPAIEVLGSLVELRQVYTRQPRTIGRACGAPIDTVTDLMALDFSDIDLLIVAVPTRAIAGLLNALRGRPGRKNTFLLLDTPPLRFSDIRKFGLFSGYRDVAVGEDWSRMPAILAARKRIQAGEIGQLRSIQFIHCGYRYHALAAFKALAGTATVNTIRRQKLGSQVAETNVRLAGGVRARIIEPRDYHNGRMLIVGSKGLISDYPLEVEPGQCSIRLQYPPSESGWYQELLVDGVPEPSDAIDCVMRAMPRERLLDDSIVNRMKIRAYASLLQSIAAGSNPYPVREGVYDYFAISLSEYFGFFADISFSGGGNSMWQRCMNFRR